MRRFLKCLVGAAVIAGAALARGLGGLGILVAKDAGDHWVNAVDLNTGSQTKRFVVAPELSSDGLGTNGIHPSPHTAWAVIDYNGSYAGSNHLMSWLSPSGLAH